MILNSPSSLVIPPVTTLFASSLIIMFTEGKTSFVFKSVILPLRIPTFSFFDCANVIVATSKKVKTISLFKILIFIENDFFVIIRCNRRLL